MLTERNENQQIRKSESFSQYHSQVSLKLMKGPFFLSSESNLPLIVWFLSFD